MQYLLLSVLAFLGVYAGFFIGRLAEEELKPGREYLKMLLHGVFVAILAIFLFLNRSFVFYITIPLILIIFSIPKDREVLYYYALAPIMLLSYFYNGFVLIAPLIFLYGFPAGSLYYAEGVKKPLKKSLAELTYRYGGFLLLGIAFEIILLMR